MYFQQVWMIQFLQNFNFINNLMASLERQALFFNDFNRALAIGSFINAVTTFDKVLSDKFLLIYQIVIFYNIGVICLWEHAIVLLHELPYLRLLLYWLGSYYDLPIKLFESISQQATTSLERGLNLCTFGQRPPTISKRKTGAARATSILVVIRLFNSLILTHYILNNFLLKLIVFFK